MYYAAADVEWTGYCKKPVQLGAILLDDEGRELSRLHRVIRPPTGEKWKDIGFMGLSEEELRGAVCITAAVRDFFKFIGKCSVVYVWGEESKVLLYSLRDRFCPEYEVSITVLQGREGIGLSSFKKTCAKLGITVDKPMHHSMNDCEYITEMLVRLRREKKAVDSVRKEAPRLKYVKREETKASIEDSAFLAVNGRTVFHRPDCRFVSGRAVFELTGYYDYFHAKMSGLAPCKCCRPEKEKPKYNSDKPKPSVSQQKPDKWDTENIRQYCESLQLSCRVYDKIIYIFTGAAEWYFMRNKDKIVLHHENWLYKNNCSKWGYGFHVQEKRFTDPKEAIFYIYCHDKKYMRARCGV